MRKTVIAVSTHNVKKPFYNKLRDIHSPSFRRLAVEFFKVLDECG
jgi:hypothetical protein